MHRLEPARQACSERIRGDSPKGFDQQRLISRLVVVEPTVEHGNKLLGRGGTPLAGEFRARDYSRLAYGGTVVTQAIHHVPGMHPSRQANHLGAHTGVGVDKQSQ